MMTIVKEIYFSYNIINFFSINCNKFFCLMNAEKTNTNKKKNTAINKKKKAMNLFNSI